MLVFAGTELSRCGISSDNDGEKAGERGKLRNKMHSSNVELPGTMQLQRGWRQDAGVAVMMALWSFSLESWFPRHKKKKNRAAFLLAVKLKSRFRPGSGLTPVPQQQPPNQNNGAGQGQGPERALTSLSEALTHSQSWDIAAGGCRKHTEGAGNPPYHTLTGH